MKLGAMTDITDDCAAVQRNLNLLESSVERYLIKFKNRKFQDLHPLQTGDTVPQNPNEERRAGPVMVTRFIE